jgi:RNA polymerase sigma-70 factor (ECF subfamily)
MPPDQQSEKLSTSLRFHPEPSPAVEPETRPSGSWTGHPLSEHERLEIFSTLRQRLLGIAYRMLGSASDAEDMLQETFIRWQQSSEVAIESPEAFLVTIITRLCLNHLQSARVKREQYFGQWLPEPVFTASAADSYPAFEMRDSISMAFLFLLERLTPLERAVFLLREVFEYEYAEISRIVEQSEANCRQILRRARQHVRQERPRFVPSHQQQEELIERFLQASAQGDMDGLLSLLSKEIVVYADGGGKTTAVPNPVYGAWNVVRFLLGARRKFLPGDLVRQVMQINGAPALVSYLHGRPYSVLCFNMAGGEIRNIYIVSNPDKLTRLPGRSPAS